MSVDVLKEYEEEAREVRRRSADWSFIEKQPPKIKAALTYYVEKGDIRIAQKFSGLSLEEFKELLRKARIPTTF